MIDSVSQLQWLLRCYKPERIAFILLETVLEIKFILILIKSRLSPIHLLLLHDTQAWLCKLVWLMLAPDSLLHFAYVNPQSLRANSTKQGTSPCAEDASVSSLQKWLKGSMARRSGGACPWASWWWNQNETIGIPCWEFQSRLKPSFIAVIWILRRMTQLLWALHMFMDTKTSVTLLSALMGFFQWHWTLNWTSPVLSPNHQLRFAYVLKRGWEWVAGRWVNLHLIHSAVTVRSRSVFSSLLWAALLPAGAGKSSSLMHFHCFPTTQPVTTSFQLWMGSVLCPRQEKAFIVFCEQTRMFSSWIF